jgi:hypothetical protein
VNPSAGAELEKAASKLFLNSSEKQLRGMSPLPEDGPFKPKSRDDGPGGRLRFGFGIIKNFVVFVYQRV